MPTRKRTAENVETAGRRQYHIGLAPGEVAPTILLCGDPARAKVVAGMFDRVRVERAQREYLTFTGAYRGLPCSVMATGMGPDNTEIAVVELAQICPRGLTMIRIGSCGALQRHIGIGECVISLGAVRLENTSLAYVVEGYPAVADPEVLMALLDSAADAKVRAHLGLTATAPGFYAAQGRRIDGFPPRFPAIPDDLARMGVSNLEMETSTLFTLSTLRGFRAGTVCAVFANRPANKFIPPSSKHAAELACIRVGLGAVVALARMDAEKRAAGAPVWRPGFRSLRGR
ncbi:MAG: nucleoside phosphorylase [Planctomycetes bacterium]|nr:nucleoside phosphorylase [Planctomycetota bacterium]